MQKTLKKVTITTLMLLAVTTIISMVSCSKADIPAIPIPNKLVVNSDKKVIENATEHQMTVNVSSNAKFKFAIQDKPEWITSQSDDQTHDKGDTISIAFDLKENKLTTDRSAVLLFSPIDSKDFTDTVYVTQSATGHVIINSEKKVTENPAACQLAVNISSAVRFKYAVKDKPKWITADGNDQTHKEGDKIDIKFNIEGNTSTDDRKAVLLFAPVDSDDYTDTVYVTQNSTGHVVINSARKVTEVPTAHQIKVNVSSSARFKYAVKDKPDWITSVSDDQTHDKGEKIDITFNLQDNQTQKDRQAILLFATADNKNFTDTVYVTQNASSYLVINSEIAPKECANNQSIIVDVSSGQEFSFNTGAAWIKPDQSKTTYEPGDHIRIQFNLDPTKLYGSDTRTADIIFTTTTSKETKKVSVSQSSIINIITPGTLEQEIKNAGIADPLTVQKLAVKGSLNSADIILLRAMTGGGQKNIDKTNGKLTDLDISGVDFVKDTNPFYTVELGKFRKTYAIDNPNELPKAVFFCCEQLKTVTIPNSVTSIGDNAFGGLIALISGKNIMLTDIKIPDCVTSIGDNAFAGCESLNNVTIPSGVTYIGKSAFNDCQSLKNITIPNGVTSINEETFNCCSSLKNITIPNSVTYIGSSAFSNCDSFTDITIPNSVTSIGGVAFCNCKSLTKVTIPSNIQMIDMGAFCHCKKLNTVIMEQSIPTTITFGEDIFEDIDPDATLHVPQGYVYGYRKIQQFVDAFKDRIVDK